MPARTGVRLERWAATIRALAPQVDATYVYFNNDERAFATRNALALRALLASSGRAGP